MNPNVPPANGPVKPGPSHIPPSATPVRVDGSKIDHLAVERSELFCVVMVIVVVSVGAYLAYIGIV